jgi:hypothetical protein
MDYPQAFLFLDRVPRRNSNLAKNRSHGGAVMKFAETSRPVFIILVLGFLRAPAGAQAPPQSDIQLPKKNEKWALVKTENFIIYSNANIKIAKFTGENLERLRRTLTLLGNVQSVNAPVPTTIFLFKNNKSFEPYNLRIYGQTPSIAGYFLPRPDGNYIAINAEHNAGQVIYHEYIHFFLNNNLKELPLWLNEGLAEYYSTFEADDKKANIGRPLQHHLAFLRSNPTMPLDRLFAASEGVIFLDEESKQGLFYAQSWLLVHYLLQGQEAKLRPGFSKFLTLLAQGHPQDKALADALGMDKSQLETELENYSRRSFFQYNQLSSDELEILTQAQVAPVQYEEVLLHLGDLLAHLGNERLHEAEAFFKEAISANPNAALAYAGLGHVEQERGKFSEGRKHFEKAIQLGPPHALTHYRYGVCLMAEVKSRARWSSRDYIATKTSREARDAFRTAIDLDQQFLEAYAAFGETFLFDPDGPFDEGIYSLEIAMRRWPSRMDIALNLLTLCARNQDSTKVLLLLDKVITPRGKPGIVAEANQRLVSVDLERAAQILEKGKNEEAIRILDRIPASAQTPRFKNQIEEMRQAAEHRHYVDLYDGAVIRASNKKFDEALERLQQIMASCKDAELKESAARLLQQVQHHQQVEWYNQALDFMKAKQPRKAAGLLQRIIAAPTDPELARAAKEALKFIQQTQQ